MKYCMLVLLFASLVCVFGCNRENDIRTVSTSETLITMTEVHDTPSHEEAYDRAVDVLAAVTIVRLEVRENLDPEDPNYDALMDAAYDKALVREAGFPLSFLRETLRPILTNAHEIVDEEVDFFDVGLTGEYVYLGFIHPNSTQGELLRLFRESVEREEERIQTFHIVVLEKVSEQRKPSDDVLLVEDLDQEGTPE